MTETAIDVRSEGTVPWSRLEQLRCELTVQIPARRFDVSQLLGLAVGAIVDTKWNRMKPVPLEVNGRRVAWCEFEVVADRLGVRVTEFL